MDRITRTIPGKTNAKSEDAEEHADGEDSLGWFWWSIKVSHGGVRGGDENNNNNNNNNVKSAPGPRLGRTRMKRKQILTIGNRGSRNRRRGILGRTRTSPRGDRRPGSDPPPISRLAGGKVSLRTNAFDSACCWLSYLRCLARILAEVARGKRGRGWRA